MKFVFTILLIVGLQAGAVAQTPDDHLTRCRATNDADVRIEACRAVLNAGTRSAEDRATAHYFRGAGYRQKGLIPLALDDFNAAIEANPALIDAYGERGIMLTVVGRFNDAIPDFTKVIDAHPRLAYAYYNRGVCYELIGLDDLAIEDISASIAIEPRAEFRYERRGTIYFRKKQLDLALADYEQALVINPQYAPALYGRGIIKMKNGDLAGGGADVAAAKHFQANIATQMSRAGVR
jgi:lipoprotein NlpI